MKTHTYLLIIFLCCLCAGMSAGAQNREEFNGPFKSWANVKTRFGAAGNGKTDDTRALQAALDDVGNEPAAANAMGKNIYSIVYLPAGTYCISSTLVLRGKLGVSIIGEDPDRTIIKWIGPDKDTLLWANGSSYFKISRLTWDANKRKDLQAIGIHWKNKWNDSRSSSHAPLNIELSDNYFIGGFSEGIGGGTFSGPNGTGSNDSEIAIKRCLFRDCTQAGVKIEGFNALDYWIWDCQFYNCRTGVNCSYGGYHIYRSLFSHSTVSDVFNNNGYYTSVRGCYSDHSYGFSIDQGSSSNPFKRVFQDNTIVGPGRLAIEYYHVGKITLWGNKFSRSPDTAIKININIKSWNTYTSEALSLHNTYSDRQSLTVSSNPNKIYAYGDKYIPSVTGDVRAFIKTLDRKPALVTRKVFEVPPGANADVIQSLLNEAAKLKGQRPIIHFAAGNYLIGRTLEIPAGTDMQLTGDGLLYASVIRADKPAAFGQLPLLHIKGPSYITLQDLQLGSESDKGQYEAISFEDIDQPYSQAHLDQVYSSHSDTSLLVMGLKYLYVEKNNSFFTTGNYIVGANSPDGRFPAARVACFGGQFAYLTVLKNARFLAKDCWWEGAPGAALTLNGAGTVTVDGAMIAPAKSDSLPVVRVDKFAGKISLLNMYIQGGIDCRPDNPNLDMLLWNIHFYHKMDPLAFLRKDASFRAAGLGLNAQCFRSGDPACKNIITVEDKWKNIKDINPFLDDLTLQTRESRPIPYTNLSPGTSNIYITRISLGATKRGIEFK